MVNNEVERMLRSECEKAKIALSTVQEFDINTSDILSVLDISIKTTRIELEELTKQLVPKWK